jgi:hypothetical protein
MIVGYVGRDAVDVAASARLGFTGQASVCERLAGATDERRFCVRQNRVVLAPVAGVKSAEVFRIQPDSQNLQSADDGDKRNSSPGRARYEP